MASFFRNTFDNLFNNISSTLNSTNSASRNTNQNQSSRPTPQTTNPSSCRNNNYHFRSPTTSDGRSHQPRGLFRPNSSRQSHQQPPSTSANRTAQDNNNQQSRSGSHNMSSNNFQSNSSTSGNTTSSSNYNTTPSTNSTAIKEDFKDVHEIRDLSDIDLLNAKQLKYTLLKNCVDYKGIIEKEELRAKVRQLWIDHHERKAMRRVRRQNKRAGTTATTDTSSANRSQDSSDEIDENQLCKICMEREIDCVLLECGHYFTCVTCGRKLAECPMCRQNVIRCVRTFRG